MTPLGTASEPNTRIDELLRRRDEANRSLFESESQRIAQCCHSMAERFARGGKLVALGGSPAARSDARHVAVEFVHPVIVGKRALPAIALTAEGGDLAGQAAAVIEPDDVVIAFGLGDSGGEQARRALALAAEREALTIAFESGTSDWPFEPVADDPFVRQEVIETLYHVLWELVHVFFDQRGLLEGRAAKQVHDAGASSFLYPFLGESQTDLDAVLADVRASVELKSQEIGELRRQTLDDNRHVLLAAAAELRRCFDAGAKLLALGNGGSATDAMDLVADLRYPPQQLPAEQRPAKQMPATSSASPPGVSGSAAWPSRRAIDLTEDTGIITAVANDIGTEEIFQRQVIAYGREGDALVALSTSGNSENVIAALAEARGRGMITIAMVGYDGGRVAGEALADHVVVTHSQNIPRIQEAQASAYHVLRELIELEPTELAQPGR